MDTYSRATIDIESLGLDQGALLLIRQALARLPEGAELGVYGQAPDWDLQLRVWCRSQGHGLRMQADADGRLLAVLSRHAMAEGRWRGAMATGKADRQAPDALAERADPAWGLAARGSWVEAGAPRFHFALCERQQLWADTAAELYAQGAAAQWDPASAIDWAAPFELPPALEAAVVQLMSYLIENENAALLLPARHLAQIHPHYREVMQLLALQCADEARHVEVFSRRAQLRGGAACLSTAGAQASLQSLFEAPDFSTASFLLAVLGEGTFVNLLNFLQAYGPDPVTRQIARLAARDEARHVAFGMAHLAYRLGLQPDYRHQLRQAIEQRFDALATSEGLNEEVFDALVMLAAGEAGVHASAALAQGHARVQALKREMADGRRARLLRLGFEREEAYRLASLHTRNFM